MEVYEAVRAAVGSRFPVTARLSVEDSVPGGLQREESLQRARLLAERGIDGFETTFGVMRSYFENIRPYVAVGRRQAWRQLLAQRCWNPEGPEAYYRPFARDVRRAAGVPTILVGGMRTTATMTDVLASGDADFVAMARPFIREPDLVRKLEAGRTGGVECVSCNMCLAHDGWDPSSAGATPRQTSCATSASATGPTAAAPNRHRSRSNPSSLHTLLPV